MGNWMRTKMFQGAPSEVCEESNTIKGVAVCTMGEAKGHGVHLDSEFVDAVVEQGNAKGGPGLKARFGHPSMCSTALGTYLGTFKNFHRDGDIARADLHISNEANNSPNGRLGDYVLGMAKNAPEQFGTSICFTPGRQYKRDEEGGYHYYGANSDTCWWEDESGVRQYGAHPDGLSEETFVEMEKLHGCDAVDEPAANEGLFSGETIAGQLETFFSDYPEVFAKLSTSPDILDAISKYGKNVNEFIVAYQERLATQTITQTPKKDQEPVNDEEQAVETEDVEQVETSEESQSTEEAESTPVEEPTEQAEEAETVQAESGEETKNEELSELHRSIKDFGSEVTDEAFGAGGGYAEAQQLAFQKMREENENLKRKLGAKQNTTEPVGHSADPEKKRKGFFAAHQ